MSSSFLPLLASVAELRFASHSVSAKMGLVVLPKWFPHYIAPEPELLFPFIQLGPKERWGQLHLSGELGIGYVWALRQSKVIDTELGVIATFSLPHIP